MFCCFQYITLWEKYKDANFIRLVDIVPKFVVFLWKGSQKGEVLMHGVTTNNSPQGVCCYVIKDGVVTQVQDAVSAQRLEELYILALKQYMITYHLSDWADDDGDNGMGYDYDNSYTIHRAPEKEELLLKDGELYGFVVDGEKGVLEINGTTLVTRSGSSSLRYGDSCSWELKEMPGLPHYAWIPNLPLPSREHRFTPEDFPEGLVSCVVKYDHRQDQRGHFDGRSHITVKLTDAAVANPEKTLNTLKQIRSGCRLIKLR